MMNSVQNEILETPLQHLMKENLFHDRTPENLWKAVLAYEGAVFYTAKGLEYSYQIKGKEMFVSRKKKTVTKASVLLAFEKTLVPEKVTGPKKLGVYGASYIYPIFLRLGIL